MFLQVSLDFFGPSVTIARTKASKIVRFLESLAAAPTSFGQLSVTPPGENHRAEFTTLLMELQATCETVSCNIERLVEDYNRRGCKGIVANCGLISLCLCTHSPSELSRGDFVNSHRIINLLNTLEIANRVITHCVLLPLPGVLSHETLMTLDGKGRAVEWMPSFTCLRPIACKAPASWIMPSACFEFRCNHALSCFDREFCVQCKPDRQPHFVCIP
jgi:hypothetical protein